MKQGIAVALFLLVATGSIAAEAAELGISKTQFTINGKPTFLLGISYYGGLGAPSELCLRDLDEMQRHGFNWLRVWATWTSSGDDVSAVDRLGNPRQTRLTKLKWLLKECDRRGMIVDVTLSRGDGAPGQRRLETLEALSRAVETLVGALKPHRNWYLDLANERNVKDARSVSFEELIELRRLVKRLDPDRLVTASHAGDMTEEEVRRYLLDVQVDFVSPHRPRNANSPGKTVEQTKRYFQWMQRLGRTVPVHYQEPFRRGYDPERWDPHSADFLADLRAAQRAGAAGWCLHNGDQRNQPDGRPRRSFDLRERRLFDQLDEEERRFLQDLKQ